MPASAKRQRSGKPGSSKVSGKVLDKAEDQPAPQPREGELLTAETTPPAPARPAGPGAALADAQIRTLAELAQALDRKALDLLDELSAAREAQAASERELAELREGREQEAAELRETHQHELAEVRRTQAMLERELAALRLVLERANRPGNGRADRAGRQANAEANTGASAEAHAARLLPLLEARLADGAVLAVYETADALARFGAAGMVDAVEGTRQGPTCHGWLLSRAGLEAEPLMFLMDDVGLLGWTEASRDRPDVNAAFPGTRPRPGFAAPLSRAPVGRLRGIVAVDQDSAGPAFFEASNPATPQGLSADAG